MRSMEFFCGAGGTALGLHRAGFKSIIAVDKSPLAVAVASKNIKGQFREFDVRRQMNLLGDMMIWGRPQLIAGSPPCTDFSKVGSKKEGSDALLTRSFTMLIGIGRPEWIFMENVPEVRRSRMWRQARETLRRQSYGLTEMVLDAGFYGVPQTRKRTIVVGRLGERDGFMDSALADAATARPMTVREILDPAISEDRALLDVGYFFVRPYTGGRGVRSIDEPCPTIIRTTRERPWKKYLANPHPRDAIPAQDAHVLTQGQLSRIQGFPVGWDWAALKTLRAIDQWIANAVPPSLAEMVGRAILARHRGETIPAVENGFTEWLCRQGKAASVARNMKANVNRARKLLGGRTYADRAVEIGKLEMAEGFDSLPTQTKSDLRTALRLYVDYQDGSARALAAA